MQIEKANNFIVIESHSSKLLDPRTQNVRNV